MIRLPLLSALALVLASGVASEARAADPPLPSLSVIGGTSFTLNPLNDFHAGAAATRGGHLALTGPAQLTLRLVNAEAALNNAFVYRGVSLFSNSDLAGGSGPSRTVTGDAGLLDFAFSMPSSDPAFGLLTNAGNGAPRMPSFAITMLGDQRARILLDDNGGFRPVGSSLDEDYDDMVVELTVAAVTPVPEPAEWAILSAGLVFAAAAGRRRRTRKG